MNNQHETLSLTNAVLSALAIAGIASMIVLAPNAIQLLKFIQPKKHTFSPQPRARISKTVNRLVRQGCIEVETSKEGERHFSLTKKGEQKLLRYRLRDIEIATPKKWDGKWRVLIFDIVEKKKKARDWLRAELRNVGFVRLQNSVWIFPYACEDFVALLKTDIQLGNNVLSMVVEKLENDQRLRKIFNLSSY